MSHRFTHFDGAGQAHMVDVGHKAETHRVARATGVIRMQAATLAMIREGRAGKGDVLGIARIAAIQGAKRTADLVPLCHPLPLTRVEVAFSLHDGPPAEVRCEVRTETVGRTGVEMEALTAVQVGLLTVYDMCKAVDRGMCMEGIRLLEKEGGRSGRWMAGTPGPGDASVTGTATDTVAATAAATAADAVAATAAATAAGTATAAGVANPAGTEGSGRHDA